MKTTAAIRHRTAGAPLKADRSPLPAGLLLVEPGNLRFKPGEAAIQRLDQALLVGVRQEGITQAVISQLLHLRVIGLVATGEPHIFTRQIIARQAMGAGTK